MRLAKLLIAIAAMWSLYWAAAAWGLKNGIAAWFDAQDSRGWQAEYSGLETQGYPFRHQTRISRPALADPRTGTAWRADWLELDSPAAWPGRLELHFPSTAQRLSYFDRTAVITADGLQASLHLKPGTALELEQLAAVADGWQIERGGETVLSGAALDLRMVQTDSPETYRITAGAQEFAPRAAWRRLLAASSALPERFDTLALEMTVAFDAAWDRSALEQQRPQPRRIDLKLADARWGDLRLKATGALTVDAQGLPEGEIALQAENWRGLVLMAERTGALPPALRGTVERVLGLLAEASGNSRDLDIALGFRDGYVTLGPLPLGHAPRLIIR
ncbi:DUF2125 domain-containing protein [Leisingera caerulea]|uniref:DUF2125 domain-containing protein n=1 Tax=Leisingera caerulea TaxID=506591 RepID=A0A9Q9LZ35_LEICA|nr:DUF2125 domain-containing protein [Leisingera caerulea]UWQ54786.1 DUF2125 domain-containing protein [Leisingera caerulea]UWQ84441.1 DUF2125 domain-containing protein [Leisingera caerulea]